MTTPQAGSPAARALPPRPNLEFLKNEAKRRLDALRPSDPRAKLSDVQFQLAREYGFASWRDLKAQIEQRADGPDPTGDWVALERALPVALHIRRTDLGGLRATLDVPSQGYFDDPVEGLTVVGDRLSFTITVRGINALYEAAWDPSAQAWAGNWTQTGMDTPMTFTRGTLPPAPVIQGLDGLWDGHLKAPEDVRVTFRIRTDEHGTLAWLESSRQEGTWFTASSLAREGDDVAIDLLTRSVRGRLSADGQRIEGKWRHGEKTVALVLNRRTPGAPAPRVSIPATFEMPVDALADFVGAYVPEGGPRMTLGIDNGRLWVLTPAGQPGFELIPTGPNAFYTRQADATVTFERDADGRVAVLVLQMRGRENRYQRIL